MRYTDEFLDQLRMQADPVADAVLERIVAESSHEQAKALFDLLIRNLHMPLAELPEHVRTYVETNSHLPEWADLDKIAIAQDVYKDLGLAFAAILYFRSLPECYMMYPDVEVLYLTGRLVGRKWPETYARRVGETTQFVIDLLGPGNLKPGGVAIEALLKVRLVHAAIRYFVKLQPEWKAEEWKQPINQQSLLYTLMTFSVSIIKGLEQLGIPMSITQTEAYFHTWRVAGAILGIRPDAMPDHLAEGVELMDKIKARHVKESEAGKACTAALVAFAEDFLKGKSLDDVPEGMIRFFIGEQADMLGVKEKLGCLGRVLPSVMVKAIGMSERIEDRFPQLEELSSRVGFNILRGMIEKFQSYKGQGLRIPAALKEAWKI